MIPLRTYALIDLDAIRYNCTNVRQKLPKGVKLLAVIKADAYGHGAVALAKALEKDCDFFGVACVEEALELRSADVTLPILILGRVFPWDYDTVVEKDIRVPVFSMEDAKALSAAAAKQNKTAPFHFCIDTGMSRIGMQVTEESADLCAAIARLPHLFAEGLFSHYATADETDLSRAVKQREQFETFVKMLSARGVTIPVKHLSNSAGIMNFDSYFDMCRMGILLYGLYPSHEVDPSLLSVRPAMQWIARISFVKTLEADREISYGGTFTTRRSTKVATIPVGYADGYPRCLSNHGKVIVNGKFAPILGRVCMDQLMVDVTGIDCAPGDEAVLVGRQGDAVLSMEEVSEAAHSFQYELPCRIARRIPRVYCENGQVKEIKYEL